MPPNPQMLIKAVSALLPEIYGERVQHDVTVGGVFGSVHLRWRKSRLRRPTSPCWSRPLNTSNRRVSLGDRGPARECGKVRTPIRWQATGGGQLAFIRLRRQAIAAAT